MLQNTDFSVNFKALYLLMRLNRPIGFFLLWWPCVWGLLLAGSLKNIALPQWPLLLTVSIGALLTRTLGCIINDITDCRIDAQVERTKNRPLAKGSISLLQAKIVGATLAFGAFITLLFLPPQTYLIALIAAGLIVLYPFAKRFTSYPQVVLAFTMNMGLLLTYVGATGSLNIPISVWLAYCAAGAWTLGYDTIYAMQDAEDDKKLRIGSTALLGDTGAKRLILLSYTLSSLLLSLIPLFTEVSRNFISGLILWVVFLMWQFFRVIYKNDLTLDDLFHSNGYGAIFLGLAFGLLN
ncbi:MAG: 4-hydroxybenzoate octaprenyltransferase [Alphaproteobacteria bacterium]|nr:MAG: 4-hydroxybenzoate octaprenyltransferase [Alphaproteobacteria bacterium]